LNTIEEVSFKNEVESNYYQSPRILRSNKAFKQRDNNPLYSYELESATFNNLLLSCPKGVNDCRLSVSPSDLITFSGENVH